MSEFNSVTPHDNRCKYSGLHLDKSFVGVDDCICWHNLPCVQAVKEELAEVINLTDYLPVTNEEKYKLALESIQRWTLRQMDETRILEAIAQVTDTALKEG